MPIKWYLESWVKVLGPSFSPNFKRILGFKIGCMLGTCCPKSRISLYKASLAHPISIGRARKPIFNSPTPIFVRGKFSSKETWLTLCNSHELRVWDQTHGLICFNLWITLILCTFFFLPQNSSGQGLFPHVTKVCVKQWSMDSPGHGWRSGDHDH